MAVSTLAALATAGTQWAVTAGFTLAMAVKTFAISFALSAVSRALAPKPQIDTATGLSSTVKSPTQPRPILYGRTKTAGTLAYIQTTGKDGKYLHMVQAMAGHEIDAYEKIYIDDELAWDNGTVQAKFIDNVRLNLYLGDQTTADADLVSESSEWTSTCVLNGVAYIYVRLEYDPEVFTNGIPNITAIVRGKRVYNPVTDVTEWTQNPALCIADYVNDSTYGLTGVNINATSLSNSITACNDQAEFRNEANQLQYHDRYRLDGYIDTSEKISSNIENMLSAMFGEMVYSQGELYIKAGYYAEPELDIDESMMVGDITLQTKQSRRSQYNGVKGVFLSSEENYVLADYPSQISDDYAVIDGDPIYLDMTLPFTTDNIRAQRLAKLALGKSRQQRVITVPVNLVGLKIKAGDNIRITNEKLGLDNAVYQVVDYELEFSEQLKVNLVCVETGSYLYDWEFEDQLDFSSASDVELYDGSAQAPTNLNLTAGNNIKSDGTTATYIDASWTAPADVYFDYFEVTITPNGGSANSFTTKESVHRFLNTDDDLLHSISVRSYNTLGRKSDAITEDVTTTIDATAPSDITSINISAGLQSITLDWTNPSEDDFDLVRIKHNTTNTEPSSHSFEVRSDSFVHDIGAYSTTKHYWLAPVDRTGNVGNYVSAGSATTGSIAIGDVPAVAGTFYLTLGDNNAPTDTEFSTAVGRDPIDNDFVVVNKEFAFNYDDGAWVAVAEFIDGSLLVTGSVNADRIEVDGTSASVTIDGDTGTPILVQSNGSTVFSVSDLGNVTMNGAYISGIPVTAMPTFESDVRAVVGAVVVDALVPATPVSYTEQDFPTNLLSSLKILDTGQSAYSSDYSYNLVLRIDDSWFYEYTTEEDKQGGQDLYYFIEGYNSVTDVWETVLAQQTYTTPVFYKLPRGGTPQEVYVIDITESLANIPSYYTGFRVWFKGVDKSQSHFANFEFTPYMTVKSGSSGFIPEDISVETSTASGGGSLSYDDQGTFTFTPASIPSLSGYATQNYVSTAISNLVDSAPTTLDTLNELASALGDDANFSTTMTTALGNKANKAGDTFTGKVTIDNANGWETNNTGSNLLRLDGADGYPTLTFASNGTINWSLYKGGAGSWVGDGSIGFVTHSGTEDATRVKFKIDTSGNITALGTITASGYNKSNWDTAYGWGNHASAGYLTEVPSPITKDLVIGGSVQASWGRPKIGNYNIGWGAHPSIGSDGGSAGQLIMLANPHIPYRTDNARVGASGRAGIRCGINATQTSWWDIGLTGDQFEIFRSASSSQLMALNNVGDASFAGTVNATYFKAIGADHTPLGTAFSNVFHGGSTSRTAYFDGSGSSTSVWWGIGNNAHAALDSNDGQMGHWVNTGSTWNRIFTATTSGINLETGSYLVNSQAVIDSSKNATFAKGSFTGTGTGGAPTLDIINTTAISFNHSVEVMTPNMTAGQHNIIIAGRSSDTKNAGYFGYLYSSAGSNSNKITFGHWGNDDLVTIDGLGNTNINEGALQIGGQTVIDASRNGFFDGVRLASGNNLEWGGAYSSGYPTIASVGSGASGVTIFYPTGNTDGEIARLNSNGISSKGRLRVSGGNNTDGNLQTSTGSVIGTYIDQFAFIDLASSHADGGWIDFSYADGGDYKGRIRYNNSGEYFRFYSNGAERFHIGNNINVLTGDYLVNGTTVIDSSRNLTNIGNIDLIGRVQVTGAEGREIRTYMPSSYGSNDIVSGHEYGWYNDYWRIGMSRSGNSAGEAFRFNYSGNYVAQIGTTGIFDGEGYRVNGTTVIDASRNLTNIGTIQNGSVWVNDGSNYNSYNENIRLFDPANNGPSVIAFGATGVSGTPRHSILSYASDTYGFDFRVGTSSKMRLRSVGVDVKNGGFLVDATTVIDASRNITNVPTLLIGGERNTTGVVTGADHPLDVIGVKATDLSDSSSDFAYIGDATQTASLQAEHSTTKHTLYGYQASTLSFKASNSSQVFDCARIVGNVDPYNQSGYQGGLAFFVKSDYSGGNLSYSSGRVSDTTTSRLVPALLLGTNGDGGADVRSTFQGDLHVRNGQLNVYQTEALPTAVFTSSGAGNYGATVCVGEATPSNSLVDSNDRSLVTVSGKYPALNLNHTVTSNAHHGPTLQFTHNGYNSNRQWVVGSDGQGKRLDFGVSGGTAGTNSNNNPHYGISGLNGKTVMRLFENGIVVGGLGAYPNVPESTSYGLEVFGNARTSGDLTVSSSTLKTAYNQAHLLYASGSSSSGSAIGFQQVTAEGWTGIFVDYNPYEGWGLYHDNPSNYFCVTAETSTGSLRSFTVPNRNSGTSTAYEKIRLNQNDGSIIAGGNITSYGNITAYASDRRLKENFVNIDSALDKVSKLNGCFFDWREDKMQETGFTPDTVKHDIGLIAQEVQAVVPEATDLAPFDTEYELIKEGGDKFKVTDSVKYSKSGENYLTVRYDKLVPLLIEAVKEQKSIVDEQQKQIENLTNLVNKLLEK